MRKYLIYICVFFFLSCWTGRRDIVDYYEITWEDYYTQGREGYCVGCQIRGVSDSIVENVRSIKWNKQIIFIENKTNDSLSWCAIIANGDVLQCGNNDKFIGSLSKKQVDSLINTGRYTDLKEEVFY